MLSATTCLALSACLGKPSQQSGRSRATKNFIEIQRQFRGRLGVCAIDTETGATVGLNQDARFAHASSFKLSLAAMLLAKGDRGEIDLGERLHWTSDDLLFVSPVTRANLVTGLTVRELARATQVTSDNTAANVLMRRFGGPGEVTRFWRSLGDDVSRLDRYEPELNLVPPGSSRDTTTPAAMARTLKRLVVGNVLTEESRETLKSWMIETETGLNRLRAGFPSDWIAGDKTGTAVGDPVHTYVDLAFGGVAGRRPAIVAAYFEPVVPAEPMDPAALSALEAVGREMGKFVAMSAQLHPENRQQEA